ncbi:hypothetical protein [Sulfurovum sp.]|nr:hypothetical protein [Sulfurovum sp.]
MWISTIKSFVLVLLLGMPIISSAAEIDDNASNATEGIKKKSACEDRR